ncbi:hypothetical protein GKJPGBOP_07743 [Streptomyces paromomycinus]|uniref:Uncharacterized protein n=1 Tax=Streptomyces paromomycinus TaxID=92743 RepID=A0A401WF73_STREY|nr:hypothetical protein GKJPGBOP_07743 [Streptomyces paromomycinus]
MTLQPPPPAPHPHRAAPSRRRARGPGTELRKEWLVELKFSRCTALVAAVGSLAAALTVGAPAATSQEPPPAAADSSRFSHEGEQRAFHHEQLPQRAMPGGRSRGVITPIGHQGFQLRYDGSDRGRVLALERRHRQLRPASLTSWLNSRSQAAVHLSRCPTRVPLSGADGFCWQRGSGDDLGWAYVPQGLTGSGEAEPRSGRWQGRSIVAASWASSYDHPSAPRNPANRPWRGAKQVDHFMKVSFTDVTDRGRPRYRSALLVAPHGQGGFTALKGHGDTLSWYGPYLFLYSSERLRVFDVRHLWATTTSSGRVGVRRGAVSANWQAAALPQVGQYSFVGRSGCGSRPSETPCFSGASIDHGSSFAPSLVTVETSSPTSRVVRWPLSPSSHLLRSDERGLVRASAGYRVPLAGPQGVVQQDERFYFTAMCPDARRVFGEPYCLYRGDSGGAVRVWSRTPAAAENLSYWPATEQLWVSNESPYRKYVRPRPELNGRVVYNVPLSDD